MTTPRQIIIHCQPQEFCIRAIGDKIIAKAYFKLTDIFLLVLKYT